MINVFKTLSFVTIKYVDGQSNEISLRSPFSYIIPSNVLSSMVEEYKRRAEIARLQAAAHDAMTAASKYDPN